MLRASQSCVTQPPISRGQLGTYCSYSHGCRAHRKYKCNLSSCGHGDSLHGTYCVVQLCSCLSTHTHTHIFAWFQLSSMAAAHVLSADLMMLLQQINEEWNGSRDILVKPHDGAVNASELIYECKAEYFTITM